MYIKIKPASVAQLDARPTGDQEVADSSGLDHKIFSTVILSLPLIQEGQMLFSGEKTYKNTDYPLRGLSTPCKSVVR